MGKVRGIGKKGTEKGGRKNRNERLKKEREKEGQNW